MPDLIGREYRVEDDAVYVPAVKKFHTPPSVVLNSKDSVVNDIIKRGQTSQPRQTRSAR